MSNLIPFYVFTNNEKQERLLASNDFLDNRLLLLKASIGIL